MPAVGAFGRRPRSTVSPERVGTEVGFATGLINGHNLGTPKIASKQKSREKMHPSSFFSLCARAVLS
jgi:hypothetical protein